MASNVLDKSYDPHQVEEKWYRHWEKLGYFRADENSEQKTYSIVIPPPNVTGVLHIGHALNNTLQDILIRFKRMQGHNVLWMPGTDHAGIATQNVVQKQLLEGWPTPLPGGKLVASREALNPFLHVFSPIILYVHNDGIMCVYPSLPHVFIDMGSSPRYNRDSGGEEPADPAPS